MPDIFLGSERAAIIIGLFCSSEGKYLAVKNLPISLIKKRAWLQVAFCFHAFFRSALFLDGYLGQQQPVFLQIRPKNTGLSVSYNFYQLWPVK